MSAADFLRTTEGQKFRNSKKGYFYTRNSPQKENDLKDKQTVEIWRVKEDLPKFICTTNVFGKTILLDNCGLGVDSYDIYDDNRNTVPQDIIIFKAPTFTERMGFGNAQKYASRYQTMNDYYRPDSTNNGGRHRSRKQKRSRSRTQKRTQRKSQRRTQRRTRKQRRY